MPATIAIPGLELLEELGHGATTTVYRASRADMAGPDVAVKILRQHTDDAAAGATFRREAALLARVTHPSLAAVHAVGEAAGRPYLVLELVDGVPLTRLLANGALTDDRLLEIAIEATEALDAVHRMRLVHRDVKPQNLLVTPDGRTKLIDFDLATWAGELAPGDTATGTLTYSAPEQTGMLARPLDARTDLYALGVVLFECATGRLPFASNDIGELLRMHAVERTPDVRSLNPQCSPGLAAVIGALLAKDPDDRYQTAAGLLADLRHLLHRPGDWPFELDTASDDRGAWSRQPRLVGRGAELSQLTAFWERTVSGGSRVLVEGAVGTGKSRLVDELVATVAHKGGRVLHAACSPDEPRPLHAFSAAAEHHVRAVRRLPSQQREAAEQNVRDAAGAGAPLLTGLSPALAALFDVDGAVLADPHREEQLVEAVATFLTGLARLEGRLLLVLDDAEHLDDASQRVLVHLCGQDEDAPLLVVLTAPPDALAPLEARLPTSFDGRIPLDPLSPAAVTELIGSELGGAEVPAEVASHLASRADGNPFAVLEFLRHLIEAGGLQPFWGTWVLDTELLDRLRLPSDVVHLVLARLEGIDASARQLLGAGAVQGMRFDVSLLAASAPAAAEDVGDAVVAATRGRVVEHVTHDVYAFLHTELRDALAATLDDAAAARLHHRIAEALEARSASDVEDVYALARHRVAAGANTNPRRTYHACLAAGQAALAHHAPTEAAAFLTSASTAAASASINLDVGFHRTYAIALLRAGDLATALDQLHAALEVEQEPVRRAELFDLVAEVHHSAGDGTRAAETVKHGLAELGAGLPKRTPLLIASTLGRVVAGLAVAASRRWYGTATGERRRRYLVEATLLDTGAQAAAVVSDIPLCFTFTLRGVFVINRIGSSPARVRLLGALAIFAGHTGASRLGMRLCASAQRDAEHIGHPALVAHSSWMRGITVLVSEWRTDAMIAALREHGRWLELPDYLMAVTSVTQALTGAGYITPAVMWVERARKRLQVDGSPRDAFPIECSASVVEAMRGQAATAETTLRAAVDAVPDAAGTQHHPLAVWARLVSLTEQGEVGSAFDEAATQFDAVPSRHGAALTMRYTLAYGRLQQAHDAKLRSTTRQDVGGASFDVAIAHAREGIKALRRGRKAPQLHAGRLVLRAWLLHLLGRDRAARRTLHRACRAVDETDAPLLSFDLAHVHARILQAGRHEAEAQRHAMTALMLAVEYGWQYRARRIRDEFSIRDHRSSSHSHGSMQTSGPTSAAHPAVHERRRLEALQHVSATAASVLDPDALIRVALDITLRLLSAERVFFFLAQDDPATGQPALLPHRGYDVDGNELRELTGYSSTLVEQVWQTGEALVVTGSEHGAALGSESAVVHGLRSILVAPLQVKGRRLGVVYLDSRVARGIFTEDDAELLTAITQQVAASLETARAAQLEAAVQAANQQRDLAETLRTSMADLNSTLDPHEVLRRLLARVAATLPGDRAALLPNEPGGVAVVIGAGPAAHDIAAQRLELDHDTALRALMTGRAPVTDTTRSHAAVLPDAVSAALGEPRSWLCVPVAVRDELAGVIVVGSPDADRYTDVEINVAAALAEQGAVAYENANLFSRVQELATTDELTGAATRRHFWELAENQRLAASRHRRPLAAIMLDIDHFKSVNDTYGHAVGDAVLREVAARLLSVIREVDIFGRYGGEEFAILLPETADASAVAERLRATVAGTEMPTDAAPVHVTISVGVSYLHPPEDLDTLLGRADAALYRSKATGRNCVTIA